MNWIERGESRLAPVEVRDGVAERQVDFVERHAGARLFAQQVEVNDAIEMLRFEIVDLIGLRERNVDAVRASDVVVQSERDESAGAPGGVGELTEERAVVAFDALLAPVGCVN